MIWLMMPAWAWNSQCFLGYQDPQYPNEPAICADGYEKARNRWVWDDGYYSIMRSPEHAEIFERALLLAGLPEELAEVDVDDARDGGHRGVGRGPAERIL